MSFLGAGRAVQAEIYARGVSGLRPKVPTSPRALEAAAAKKMSAKARAYVIGSAGDERTVRANRKAIDRVDIVPRMLRDTTERSMDSTLLGMPLAAPVLLAPVGAAGMVKARADVVIGKAAANVGVPYILSSQGSCAMEDTVAAMRKTAGPRGAQHWFQLYWSKDLELVRSFVRRAEATGAGAIVLTVDTTLLGWRPRDLNLGSLPFSRGIGIAQYTSDPRFQELVAQRLAEPPADSDAEVSPTPTPAAVATLLSILRNHPGRFADNLRSPIPRAAVQTFLDVYSNPALSWDHVKQLREMTSLPIVLKGLLHPGDAVHAFKVGVDAVMVSNHGGRQVDGSVAALDALRQIRAAVPHDATLIFDSGIRSGADVFVALASGANAVTIGRPHIYGLAVDGQRGVEAVLRNIIGEFDLTMALAGTRSLDEITETMIRVRSQW